MLPHKIFKVSHDIGLDITTEYTGVLRDLLWSHFVLSSYSPIYPILTINLLLTVTFPSMNF